MAAPKNPRRKIDPSTLSPEELVKYNEAAAKRSAPRPAYLVYKVVTDSTGAPDFDLHSVTRSAEEALAVIDEHKGEGLTYKRILIK